MAGIPPETFADRLRELDEEGFGAFVAALWAARGYDVDRDCRRIRVEASGDGDRLSVVTVAAGSPVPELPADVVVAAESDRAPVRDRGDDAEDTGQLTPRRTVGPGELRRMTLYAVEPGDRRGLLADHLDASPTVEGPTPSADRVGEPTDDGSPEVDSGTRNRDAEPTANRSGGSARADDGNPDPERATRGPGRERGPDEGPGAGRERSAQHDDEDAAAGTSRVPDHPAGEGADRRTGSAAGGREVPSPCEDRVPEWTPAGVGPTRSGRPGSPAGREAAAGDDGGAGGSVLLVVGLLALGSVAVGLAVAGAGDADLSGEGPLLAAGGSGAAGAATPTEWAGGSGEEHASSPPFEEPEAPETATPSAARPAVPRESYPPGLGPGGVIDAKRLGTVHESAVRERSYRLTIVYREYTDERLLGAREEVVRASGPTDYTTDVTTVGSFVGEWTDFDEDGRYVLGEFEYTRVPEPDEPRYYGSGGFVTEDGQADQATRIGLSVAWMAAANRTAVVGARREGNRTYFRVRFTGDRFGPGEDVRGSLLVDDRGIVHELRRTARLENHPDTTAELVVRYGPIGTGTDATNETAATGETSGSGGGNASHAPSSGRGDGLTVPGGG